MWSTISLTSKWRQGNKPRDLRSEDGSFAGTHSNVARRAWIKRGWWLKKYGLLTKLEIKMARCWPSSFFTCLWTEVLSKSIITWKRRVASIWLSCSNKLGRGLIIWHGGHHFFSEKQDVILHKPSSSNFLLSQSQHRIGLILPTCGATHVTIESKPENHQLGILCYGQLT